MLQTTLSDEDRPRFQGVNDTIIAVSSSVASLLSGGFYVGVRWTVLAGLSAPVLLLFGLALLRMNSRTGECAT